MPIDLVVNAVEADFDGSLSAYRRKKDGRILPTVRISAGVIPVALNSGCGALFQAASLPLANQSAGPCIVQYVAGPASPAAVDLSSCVYPSCQILAFAGSTLTLRLAGTLLAADGSTLPGRVRRPQMISQ